MPALELYQSTMSPCAQKVRLSLAEKGLPYTSRWVDIIAKENLRPEYLALNPKGVVPTLVHNGNALIESALICEYLEDAFPQPSLRPQQPLLCQQMRLWTRRVDEQLHPATGALVWAAVLRNQFLDKGLAEAERLIRAVPDRTRRERQLSILHHAWQAPDVIAAASTFRDTFEDMNEALDDQQWLVDDGLSLADLALAPYAQSMKQLQFTGPMFAGLERVQDWFERIQQRDSYRVHITEQLPAERVKRFADLGGQSVPELERLLAA